MGSVVHKQGVDIFEGEVKLRLHGFQQILSAHAFGVMGKAIEPRTLALVFWCVCVVFVCAWMCVLCVV